MKLQYDTCQNNAITLEESCALSSFWFLSHSSDIDL